MSDVFNENWTVVNLSEGNTKSMKNSVDLSTPEISICSLCDKHSIIDVQEITVITV